MSGDLFQTDTTPPDATLGYALVAPERGIDAPDGGLTYAIPAHLRDLAVGDRVTVPLGRGNKPAKGFVVGLIAEPDGSIKRIKPIVAREYAASSLPEDLITLAKWIAGYYCCPLGMTFGALLPAAVKHATGQTTRLEVRVVTDETQPIQVDDAGKKQRKPTKLQQAILDAAAEHASEGGKGWIDAKALADHAGAKSTSAVTQLLEKGLLESRRAERVVSDLDLRAQQVSQAKAPPPLTPAQQNAVDRLIEALPQGFSTHLLHGVTGSGKTEVYLRVIQALLEAAGDQGSGISDRDGEERIKNDPHQRLHASPPNPKPQTPDPIPDPTPGIIVLVPEIALTPQTVGRFLARFPDGEVAVLHSGLTASQRHAQWRRIRDGRARVVVGARSAIFAPLPRVGLIIVDEEHESSYKQDQLPRYHARDVAIKRAHLAGCPILLGSATPSLESAYNAGVGVASGVRGLGSGGAGDRGSGIGDQAGPPHEPLAATPIRHPPSDIRHSQTPTLHPQTPDPGPRTPSPRYSLIELPDRVPGAKLPSVEIVDLSEERRERKGIHLLSRRLELLLRNTIEVGGQAILLLNRRGYANYIACPDHRCGWMMRCDHCDVTMVYHRDKQLPAGGVVRCHHCNAEQLLQSVCPDSGHKVSVFGLGTQRVEEELVRKFADVPIARMDADSMRTARDYQRTLDGFARGDSRVLLGTQMIAKGLDVANVRLVGVISADTALNLPDFRAAERTFQLIAQVAGRAGRGEHRGRVVVQTFNPEDPAIRLAADHDYVTFATQEIATRAQAGLPPIGRMARIVLRDTDHLANAKRAHELAQALNQANQQLKLEVRLRGPMVCPIARLADHHRQQIELIAPASRGAASIQKLLTALRNQKQLISDTHTAVDVDPVALL